MTTRRDKFDLPEELRAHLADEHASEQRELSRMWEQSASARPFVEVDASRKAEIRAHILREAGATEDRPARPPLRLYRTRVLAAAAVIACLVGVSFLYAPTVRTLDAPVGEGASFRFELADGSSVVLAAGSSLSLTTAFGDANRRVRLVGEGYFEVTSSVVPFVIDTYNARTQVLGTRFSVRAWSREIDSATEVMVEEGVVSVSSTLDGDKPVRITAGEAASVPYGSTGVDEIQEIDIARAFTWTQGGYEYSNEPLGNVLDDLERRFDLNLEAPEGLRLRPITIYNRTGPEAEEILGDISAAIGVRYRRIADGFELYPQQQPDTD